MRSAIEDFTTCVGKMSLCDMTPDAVRGVDGARNR